MIATIPQITKNFYKDIKEKSEKGIYTIKVGNIKINVFPYVFPPSSPFSESSHTVYDEFGDLSEQKVLDIGTGTGIQAIQATLAGAEKVDAVDIYDNAVRCAQHNVNSNRLANKIRVWNSDLFSGIPKGNKYDLIIANLPIVDAEEKDIRFHSLIDPGFIYHERLFSEAQDYLDNEGIISLCHADLQSKEDFSNLEDLAIGNGFDGMIVNTSNSLGHEWRKYEFKVRK